MLFLEEIAAAKRSIKLQIFASDVDDDAVALARNGLYPESIAADVSPQRLARFFTKEEHGYRVVPELRGAVVFTVQDVLADPPFSRLDLVSCRNLLIYLRPEAQEKVLLLFHFALREGGILFLGGSETVGSLDDRFEPISKTQRIYRQIGRSRPGEVDFPIGSADGRARNLAGSAARGSRAGRQRSRSHAAAAARDLCAGLGPDQSQGRVSLLLRDRPTAICGWPRASPAAICSRWRARGCATSSGRRSSRPAGSMRTRSPPARRRARRQRGRGQHRGPAGAARRRGACCWSASSTNPTREAQAGRPIEPADDVSRVAELEQELEATRKELESAIHDLEIANEELKAINEEAMSVERGVPVDQRGAGDLARRSCNRSTKSSPPSTASFRKRSNASAAHRTICRTSWTAPESRRCSSTAISTSGSSRRRRSRCSASSPPTSAGRSPI